MTEERLRELEAEPALGAVARELLREVQRLRSLFTHEDVLELRRSAAGQMSTPHVRSIADRLVQLTGEPSPEQQTDMIVDGLGDSLAGKE